MADNATVAFRGNRYSVPPGLTGSVLEIRHRLSTQTLEVHGPSGALVARHALAPAGSGIVQRLPEHRAALEAAVLAAFTTDRPCDRKANRPPGPEALAEAARLLGAEGREVMVDLAVYGELVSDGMSEDSIYQQLRSHLAYLRLAAAAEALPGELDHALKTKLTHTAFLERLLAVEVAATELRRRSSLERFASLPSLWRLSDFDFDAQPSVDKKTVDELATLRFLEDATNVLVHRASRCGQDHAGRRARPGVDRRRLPHLLHDRGRSGGPLPPGRSRGPVGDDHAVLRRTPTPGHRRGGLPARWPTRPPPRSSRSSPPAT